MSDPAINLVGVDLGGYWSGPNIDSLTGQFNPAIHNFIGFCDSLTIYYTIPGIYGDMDSTTVVICMCSGVEENTLQNAVLVSPNPSFDGLFNFHLEALKDWEMEISISDITGRFIQKERLKAETSTWQLDLSDQSPGTYLLTISGEFGAITKKLINFFLDYA